MMTLKNVKYLGIKMSYGFNRISGMIFFFFADINKLTPKCLRKGKEMWIAQIILKKKKVEGIYPE